MDIFRNKPFAATLAAFLALSLLIGALSVKANAATLLLAVAALLLLLAALAAAVTLFGHLGRISRLRAAVFLVSLALLSVGVLRVGARFVRNASAAELVGERVSAVLSLEECETESVGYARYRVLVKSVRSCDGEALPQKPFYAVLVLESAAKYRTGDVLGVDAEIVSLSEISEAAYAMANGCAVGIFPTEMEEGTSVELLEENTPSAMRHLTHLSSSLRERLSYAFAEGIGGDAGALAAAVLLGDRSALPPTVTRDFSRAGISHLLAVSGLHMTLLIVGLRGILRLLGLSRRISSALSLPVIPAYLLLTGLSMSACRAGLMLAVLLLLDLLARRPDALTSLFLAVSVIVLAFPAAVFSVGLWLSFSSVLGLLILSRPIDRAAEGLLSRTRGGRALRCASAPILSAVGVSLVASFSTLPVLTLAGMELSLVSALSNPLTVPLMPLLLVMTILSLVFGPSAPIAAIPTLLVRMIGGWCCSVAAFLSDLRHATVSMQYPFAAFAVLVFTVSAGLLLVLPIGRLRQRLRNAGRTRPSALSARWMLIPALAAVTIYAVGFSIHAVHSRIEAPLPVTVVHTAGGEHLVCVRDGVGLLIDLSDGEPSGYKEAMTVGRELGVTEWEAVVVTHGHAQTATSVARLARRNLVRRVCLPGELSAEGIDYCALFRDRLAELDVAVEEYARNSVWTVGEWSMLLLSAVYKADSAQPIFYMTVESRDSRLVYMTGALTETGLWEEAKTHLSGARYLLYGSDGPETDAPLTVPVGEAVAVLTYGEETLARLEPDCRTALEEGSAAWIHDGERVALLRSTARRMKSDEE